MAVNVDTLQITIEAEASKAAEQVNALVSSLGNLQEIAGADYSKIVSSIKSIAKAAEDAMPSGTKDRKNALDRVSSTATPKVDTKQSEESLDNLSESAEKAGESVDKLGRKKTKAKIEADTSELEKASGEYKEYTDTVERGSKKTVEGPKVEAADTQTALEKFNAFLASIENLSKAAEPAANSLKAIGDSARDISTSLRLITGNANETAQAINSMKIEKTVGSGFTSLANALEKATPKIEGVLSPIERLGDAVSRITSLERIADSVAGFFDKIVEATQRNDVQSAAADVEKLANAIDKIEVPSKATLVGQTLKSIAEAAKEISGVSGDTFSGLKDLKDVKAPTGISTAVKSLKELDAAAGTAANSINKSLGKIEGIGESAGVGVDAAKSKLEELNGALDRTYVYSRRVSEVFENMGKIQPADQRAQAKQAKKSGVSFTPNTDNSSIGLERLNAELKTIENTTSEVKESVKAFTEGVKTDVDAAVESIGKLDAAISKFDASGLDKIYEALAKVNPMAEDVEGKFLNMTSDTADTADGINDKIKPALESLSSSGGGLDALKAAFDELSSKAETAGKTIEKFNSIVNSIPSADSLNGYATALESLQTYKASIDEVITSLRELTTAIRNVTQAAGDFNGGDGFDILSAKVERATDLIGTLIQGLVALSSGISAVSGGDGIDSVATSVSGVTDAAVKATEAMSDLSGAVSGFSSSKASDVSQNTADIRENQQGQMELNLDAQPILAEVDPSSFEGITESVKKIRSAAEEAKTALEGLKTAIGNIKPDSTLDGYKDKFDLIVTGVDNAEKAIQALNESLSSVSAGSAITDTAQSLSTIDSAVENTLKSIESLNTALKGISGADSIGRVSEAISYVGQAESNAEMALKRFAGVISGLDGKGIDTISEQFKAVTTSVGGASDSVDALSEKIANIPGADTINADATGISEMGTKSGEAAGRVDSLASALSKLTVPEGLSQITAGAESAGNNSAIAAKNISDLADSLSSFSLPQALGDFVKSIGDAAASAGEAAGKVSELSNAISGLKTTSVVSSLASDMERLLGLANTAAENIGELQNEISKFSKPPALSNLPSDIAYVGTAAGNAAQSVRNLIDALSKVSTVQSLSDIRKAMEGVITAAQDASKKVDELSDSVRAIPASEATVTLSADISNTGTAAENASGTVRAFGEALSGIKSPIALDQLTRDVHDIGTKAVEASTGVQNLTQTLSGITLPQGLSDVSTTLQDLSVGAQAAAEPVQQFATNLSAVPDMSSVLSSASSGIGSVGTAAGAAQGSVDNFVASVGKITSSADMGKLSGDIEYISSKAGTASAAIRNLSDTLKQVSSNQSIQDVSAAMESVSEKSSEAWKAVEKFGERVSGISAPDTIKAITKDISKAGTASGTASKNIQKVSDATKKISSGSGISALSQKLKDAGAKAKTAADKINSVSAATGRVTSGGIPKVTADIKAITRACQGASSSLKSLSDRLSNIYPGTGLTSYATSLQEASEAVSEALQSVQNLSDALSKMSTGGSLGTVNTEFTETRDCIEDVITEVSRLNQALSGIAVGSNLSGVQNAFGGIAESTDNAASGIDQLSSSKDTISAIEQTMDSLRESIERVSGAANGLKSVLEEVGAASKKVKTIKVKAAKGEDAQTPKLSSVTVEVPKPEIPTPEVETVEIPVTADVSQAEEQIEDVQEEASKQVQFNVEASVDSIAPETIVPTIPTLMNSSGISAAQSSVANLTQGVTALGSAVSNTASQSQTLVNTLSQAAQNTISTTSGGAAPVTTVPPSITAASQVGTSAAQAANAAAQAANTATQSANNAAQATQSVAQAAANVSQAVGSASQSIQSAGQASINASGVFNSLKASIDAFGADTGGKMLIQAQAQVNAMEDNLRSMQERLSLLQALMGHEKFEFPGMAEAESRMELYQREIDAAVDALSDLEDATIKANAGVQNNGLQDAIQQWNLFATTSKLAGQEISRSMKDASVYTKEFLAMLKQYATAQTYIKGLNASIEETASNLERAKSQASTEGLVGKPEDTQQVTDAIAKAEAGLASMREEAAKAQKTLTDVGEAITERMTGDNIDIEMTAEQIKTMTAQLTNISVGPKKAAEDVNAAMKEIKTSVSDTEKAMSSFGKSGISTDRMTRSLESLQQRLENIKSSIYNGNPEVENTMQQEIPMVSVVSPDYSEAITALNEFADAHDKVMQKHQELDDLMSRAIGGESIPTRDLIQLANEYNSAQRAAKEYEAAAKEAMSRAEGSISDARKAMEGLASVDLKNLKVEADTKSLQEQLSGMKANTDIGSMAKAEIDTASTAMDKYTEAQQAVIDKAERLREALTNIQLGAANALPISQLEDLKRELSDATSNASTFGQIAKTEMSAAKKAVDDATKAVSGFEDLQSKLGSGMESATTAMTKMGSTADVLGKKLGELESVGGADAASTEFGNARASVDKFAQSVADAKAKITEIQKELQNLSSNPIDLNAVDAKDQIAAASDRLSNLNAEYATLNRTVKQCEADAKSATMSLAGFGSTLKNLDDATFSISKMEQELAKMTESLKVAGERPVADMVVGNLGTATNDLKAYAQAEQKAADAKQLFENAKAQLNVSGSGVTVADVEQLSKAFDMAENSAKHMGQTAKASLHDLETSISGARSAMKSLETSEAALTGFSGQKDVYSAKITRMRENPEVSTVASEAIDEAVQKYATFEAAVKKSEDATARLREEIEKIKTGSVDAIPISQLKDFTDACETAKREAKAAFSDMRSSAMTARTAVSDVATSWNKLNTLKLTLEKQLGVAQTAAERLDGSIATLKRKLDTLKEKGADISDAAGFSKAQTDISALETAATATRDKIDTLKAALDSMNNNPIDLDADDALDQIDDMIEKLQSLRHEYDVTNNDSKLAEQTAKNSTAAVKTTSGGKGGGVSEEFSNLDYSLGVLKTSISSTAPVWDTLKAAAAPALQAIGSELDSLIASCPKLGTALSASSVALSLAIAGMRSAMNEMSVIFGTVLNAAKKLGNYVAGQLRKDLEATASALKNIAKNASKAAVSGFKKLGDSVKNELLGPLESVTSAVKTWMNSIGRIAFYRMVRGLFSGVTTAIKEGIDNLYEYSKVMGTTFASSMNSLATSAQYLKNSIASMVAPLINAVAPAIDFVIDKFVALINIIGKVFAALTGKTVYTQAKKQAVEYNSAAQDATDSTKELQKYLLGIDELNIINDNDSGSSGSGSGVDYSDMFEEVEVPNEISDWVEQIKQAMEAGDWYGVGEIIADKLNEIVAGWDAKGWGSKIANKLDEGLAAVNGFLENFRFTSLGEKVGDLLNGIIDNLNFDEVGSFFANKMNAFYDFVKGIVTTLHWAELGDGIGEAVNTWIDKVHWADIGYTWSKAIEGVFTMLTTAIKKIDWYSLGRGIATAINSFEFYDVFLAAGDFMKASLEALYDLLSGFNDTLEWDTIARRIYSGINDGFIDRNIEWERIGNEIGETFTNIFNLLRDIIQGIHWYQLGEDMQSLLEGVEWDSYFGSLSGLISDAINAAIETLAGLVSDAKFWDSLSESLGHGISAFIVGVQWGSLFNSMVQLVIDALNAAITAITDLAGNGEFWANLQTGIGEGIRQIIDNKEKWVEFFENFPTVIAEALNVAVAALDELTAEPDFWTDLGEAIGTGINNFIETFNWEGFFTGLANLVQGILNGAAAAVSKINWEELGTKISNAIEHIDWKSLLASVGTFVIDTLGAALKLASIGVSLLLEVGKNIVQGLLDGIVEGIKNIGTWLKTHLIDPLVEGVKNLLGIASPSTVFKEIGDNIVQGLLDGVKGLWDSVVKFFTESFDNIVKTVSETWENVKKATSEAWENIKKTLTETWENLKKDVTDKFDAIKKKLSDVWDEVKKKVSETWENIKKTLTETWENIKSTAQEKFEAIKTKLSEIWENVKTKVTDIWNSIKTFVTETWENIKASATEKFEAIKTKLSEVWENVKTKVTDIWNNIKTFLSDTWENIKTAAADKFKEIKEAISEKWDDMKKAASDKWEEIKTSLSDAWGNLKTEATKKFNEISKAISDIWDNLVTSALSWGKDIINNIVDGISDGISVVKGAVKNVSQAVQDFLGFSEPDEGPLSNFHTYMPDMMQLMAKGINDNSNLPLNAIDNVAATMQEELKGIGSETDGISLNLFDSSTILSEARNLANEVASQFSGITADIEFKEPELHDSQQLSESFSPRAYMNDAQSGYNPQSGTDFTVQMQANNDEVINTMNAIANQIIRAINESGNKPIMLDGRAVSSSMTTLQNRTNILYGKTQQNS